MAANRKSELYKQLKASGRPLSRSYREYTTAQLEEELGPLGPPVNPSPPPQVTNYDPDEVPAAPAWAPPPPPQAMPEVESPPLKDHADPDELPGQRANTFGPLDVIRVDSEGRRWHQEEVRKPAYPKPRGRRILRYMDTGVRTETVHDGQFVETFEVAGNEAPRPSEVKITLPSYQVGIYTDPRFPFRIHCYNGREGFNLYEVEEYFGGSEMVPATCKRVYVENDLCYDIRSVIRTIQTEYRQLQLTGRAQ